MPCACDGLNFDLETCLFERLVSPLMKTYVSLLSVLLCVAMSTSVMASGADSSAYQGALFNGDSTRFADAILEV